MLPAMLQRSFMGGALTKDTESPSVAKFGGVFFFAVFILHHLIRDKLSPLSCLKHSIPNFCDFTFLPSLWLTKNITFFK